MRREHLKAARLALGLSALALGEKTGIKEERIFAVERGRYRPRLEEGLTWATALNMRPEVAFPELFDDGGRT